MAFPTSSGGTAPPPRGTWVLGVDSAGTAYLFKQGTTNPSGQTATAAGLGNWVSLGTSDMLTMSTRLGQAMSQLGSLINPVQQSGLMQAVDSGSIALKGATYEDIPASIQPGAPSSEAPGSATSGSEAVASNIIPSPSISATSLLGTIWGWLTAASNWVRVLEYVGGAVLVYLGIKGLTGVEAGPGGKV